MVQYPVERLDSGLAIELSNWLVLVSDIDLLE